MITLEMWRPRSPEVNAGISADALAAGAPGAPGIPLAAMSMVYAVRVASSECRQNCSGKAGISGGAGRSGHGVC